MARPVIIANCSAFYGDRISAAAEMVEGGSIDVLTGDWLAELTMLILARAARRNPSLGYAQTFVRQMEQILGTCVERGIRVVANAGGLNPRGCAEAVAKVAGALGIHPQIAYVTGDDLLPGFGSLRASGHCQTMPGSPDIDLGRVVSANAYLGGWAVTEALAAGADVVITGRTTDAALVSGPAAWWHGWARDDWDALAGAVVAGHVIECGTQATGGNYSFFREVKDMTRPGFPWAEIASDGSSIIGKHQGTGGEVSVGTVTSQLLYEIGGPRYLGPDVIARFDTIRLSEAGTDRIRVSGARGEPPTGSLKVSVNMLGGFRNDIRVAVCGPDIAGKAQLLEAAFWEYCPYGPAEYAEVAIHLDRTDKEDAGTNEEAVAVWQIILKDADETKVGRAVSDAAVEMSLSTSPGFFLLSGPPRQAREYGVHASALVPANLVKERVSFLDGHEFDLTPPAMPSAAEPLAIEQESASMAECLPATRTYLGSVVGARSGDKGGDANVGVFARSELAWHWLDSFLTTEMLRDLLPEVAALSIERYRLPLIRSLNFVIHGLLGDGVAASTRQDAQAKSLGEWLRSRVVDVPTVLLDGLGSASRERKTP